MKKYIKNPVVITAFTFNELVEFGKYSGGNIVNGMPWSFDLVTQYVDDNGDLIKKTHPITHENDNCYLIFTLEGTMKFNREDMLIVGIKGEIYLCKKDIFDLTYEVWNED